MTLVAIFPDYVTSCELVKIEPLKKFPVHQRWVGKLPISTGSMNAILPVNKGNTIIPRCNERSIRIPGLSRDRYDPCYNIGGRTI